MYLSRLKLEPSSRTTRTLYLNPYLLHQSIFRAFPDETDGGPGRVLYRLDIGKAGSVTLYVQSEKPPAWDKAQMLADCLDRSVPDPRATRPFAPAFSPGQRLRFRLRANPSVKKQVAGKKNGQRLGLFGAESQLKWLQNKSAAGGFALLTCVASPEGPINDSKRSDPRSRLSHYSVKYEGVLQVVNPAVFSSTLESGIGPAKGFGFGLLSLASLKD